MTGSGDNGARATPAQFGEFTATHWSVVLAAGQQESPRADAALERLCRTYWYALYVYVRRRGHSPEDAQDLTQQFFALFLQKEYFRLADPQRGRFRTFLLHALEHFLVNEWKRAQRAKRGGGAPCLSLDADGAERRYAVEPLTMLTPERAYEKRWARTLLEQVLAALQQEYVQSNQDRLFDALAEMLWGKDASVSYAQIGERLGMSEGAVGVAMHRLRRRYQERLRTEVAHTVAEPGEVDEELHYLLAVVSG
ncbi:MAG: sigma-70 family RNA polymerase sigma factor [Verrucomicrobia bacterium]|nr:sigma-70 family RNA polymerase sigma factor [Verrucomicrobiota bacterium]